MRTVERRLSWGELMQEAEREPNPNDWPSPSSLDVSFERDTFSGVSSYDDAMRLLRQGWKEGRDKIVSGLQAVVPPTIREPVRRMDVAGAYPVVPIALSGDPASMVDHGTEIAQRPTVRLVISTNGNSNIPAQTFINRGVAICSVVDAMEAAGQRVEIIACNTSVGMDGGKTRYLGVYTVKDPDQPIELDRMAFAFAHPACHRRINFRMYELYMPYASWGKGYGYSKSPDKAEFPDAIILPMPTDNAEWSTSAKALSTVCEQFRLADIEIEEPTHA